MSDTLVTKTLRAISALDDDFYKVNMVVDALNKAQRKVLSYAVQKERQDPKRSLRALDLVRRNSDVEITSFNPRRNFYVTQVGFPSIELSQFLHLQLKVNQSEFQTPLRELVSSRLHQVEAGNIVPTRYEGYYHVNRTHTAGVRTKEKIVFVDNGVANWVNSTLNITAIRKKVDLTFKANQLNLTTGGSSFVVTSGGSAFVPGDTLTLTVSGTPYVLTASATPGAAQFVCTTTADQVASNIVAAFTALAIAGLTFVVDNSINTKVNITRVNTALSVDSIIANPTAAINSQTISNVNPESAVTAGYLTLDGTVLTFAEPVSVGADANAVASNFEGIVDLILPAGYDLRRNANVVSIVRLDGQPLTVTGNGSYTDFIQTIGTSGNATDEIEVTFDGTPYAVPIGASETINQVLTNISTAIPNSGITEVVSGTTLTITPTGTVAGADKLEVTPNADIAFVVTNNETPSNYSIKLRGVIDSIPRVFEFAGEYVLEEWILAMIAAINADEMFYFSAQLDPEDLDGLTVILTAKGVGSKFNGVLSVVNVTNATQTKTVVEAGVNETSSPVFDLYLHSNDNENELRVFYVDNPRDVTAYDETFHDLPEQLENAAVYAACSMLLMSEKPGEGEKNVVNFAQLYQEELQAAMY